MAKNEVIHVGDILMDKENPRHDIIDGQEEILNWHVENLDGKLITLMRSIAQNGLSEIDRVLVMPIPGSAGKYVVKEGNRRIAALKLLFDPSLCIDSVFRRRIESVSVGSHLSFEVECVVSDNRERVLWMMGLRHLGLQGGEGTFAWGAAEKNRHDLNESGTARYWRSLEFIDYAQKNGLITDQQAARLNEKISNLDRLVPNNDFKNALGVTYTRDRRIVKTLPKEVYDRVLANILDEFSRPDFKVKNVYSDSEKSDLISRSLKKAQEQLGAGFIPDLGLKENNEASGAPSTPKPSVSENSSSDSGSPNGLEIIDKLYPKPRRQPDPSQRDKLFLGKIGIPTNESKCNRLYTQIDGLKLSEHGLVVACGARALLEISTKVYIDKFSVQVVGKPNSFGQHAFGDMLKACAGDLFDKGKISKELMNTIVSGEAANPHSFASPQSLHSYIHGRYQNSMDSLKAAWDKCYEEYLRSLWMVIKENKV